VILGSMDILKMLSDLQAERQRIEETIDTIERLAVGTRAKRRGRPPNRESALNEETLAAATFSTKRAASARARKQIAGGRGKRPSAKKA